MDVCCCSHTGDLFKNEDRRTLDSLGVNLVDLPVLRKAVIAPFKDAGISALFSIPGSHFSSVGKD